MNTSKDTIQITAQELENARLGLESQAKSCRFDLTVPANKAFFDLMVTNFARSQAWARFFTNALHASDFHSALEAAKRQLGVS